MHMTDTTQAKVTDTTQAKARSTISQALAAFVDALLPGNTEWPSGATLGIQHPMLERLVAQNEENALLGLAQSLESIGAPFVGLDAQARTAALKKMEKSEPDRFQWLCIAAYQAYYENPAIVELINARGTPYKLRPHAEGYDQPKFNLATQTPKHGRGSYIRTSDVKPVDISDLNLDTEITTKWGLQR